MAKRRKYRQIRREIIASLKNGPKSMNELSKETNSTWLTIRRHLEYLGFKNKVEMMISKPRMKIFRLKNKIKIV